jgi:hypothetical protein
LEGELKYKMYQKKNIGYAFASHKFPGNGFLEVIYQRAVAIAQPNY